MQEVLLITSRRNQLSIIREILTSCSREEGATKTAIVYKIGFNFGRVEKYINLLLNKNLVEQVETKPYLVYKITNRGQQALKVLSDADSFIFGMAPQLVGEIGVDGKEATQVLA
jgi:predicted transcriptional regulator